MITHRICPICASPEQEALFDASRAENWSHIVRCPSCRFIYRRSLDITYLPSWVNDGEEIPPALVDTTSDVILRQRLSLLENAVSRGRLLDIGCGSGRLLALARQRGWDVAGVESSANAKGARELLGEGVVATTLAEGLWPAGSFDAISLWNALERSRHPAELLRLAAHYARIDGVLVVQTPNGEQLHRRQELCAMAGQRAETAEHLFSPASLQRLLGRYGFRVERIERGLALETTPGDGVEHPTPSGHAREHRGHGIPVLSRSLRRTLAPPQREEILIVTARYIP